MTENYRGSAHDICNINVRKQQSNFIPIIFHNFSNYDAHLFFRKLVEKPRVQKLKKIPKTKEEYISVTFGCIRFIDSYKFLQSSLNLLMKSLQKNDLKKLEKIFLEEKQLLAYPYDNFKFSDDYETPIHKLDRKFTIASPQIHFQRRRNRKNK